MPAGLLLASTLLPAAYQIGQGFIQRNRAKKLKESTYIPEELLMNRDLAQQQAYSRRAPGQARAEENNRRILSTTIAANSRMAGGDVNKSAALTSSASARAYDANAALQDRGQQFSENAFARMAQANLGIGAQKQRNRDDYTRTKSDLIAASDQNFFNGLSGVASAGVAFGLNGGFGGGSGGGGGKGSSSTIAGGNASAGPGYNPNSSVGRFNLPPMGQGFSPYSGYIQGGNPMDPNNYNPSWRQQQQGFQPQFYPSPAFRRHN